jgi:hypothetical protein
MCVWEIVHYWLAEREFLLRRFTSLLFPVVAAANGIAQTERYGYGD